MDTTGRINLQTARPQLRKLVGTRASGICVFDADEARSDDAHHRCQCCWHSVLLVLLVLLLLLMVKLCFSCCCWVMLGSQPATSTITVIGVTIRTLLLCRLCT